MHNYHPILSGTVNNHLGLEKNVKGSRFVFNEIHESGKIYTKGKTYTSQGINIDALNKDLVIQIEKDSILVLEKSKIDSIQIGNHRFKKIHDNLFYEILWEKSGNFFIKEYNCYIKKGQTNVMKGTTENDRYVITENYHLYKNGTLGNAFDLNKKTVINLFKENKEQIKKYVRDHKLNLKSEADVILLFSAFSTK